MKKRFIGISMLCLLYTSCSSYLQNKEQYQNAVYLISENHFLKQLENNEKDEIWVNDKTNNHSSLDIFKDDSLSITKISRFEFDLSSDSILAKEILKEDNILHFKHQLNNYEFSLVSKKLGENSRVGIIPTKELLNSEHISKDVYFISSIMFTKDGHYALFYYGKTHSHLGLRVYKRRGKKWLPFKRLGSYTS